MRITFKTQIRKTLYGIVLVGIMLFLWVGDSGSSTASAQEVGVEKQNLPIQSSITFPNFKLPWDPSENRKVLWTGGPHSWSKGGQSHLKDIINAPRGSGLDFAAHGVSFKVISMADGVVVKNDCGFIGFGCIVAIKHDVGGSVMIYAHLMPKDINGHGHQPLNTLNENTWYSQGTEIGYAGSSGQPTGSPIHLHIEFRDGTSPCNAAEDCGDIGWAGNPVGWDGKKLVDNYWISAYIADIEGCGPDCDTIYNYDGSAVKGSILAPIPNFPYIDVNIRRHVLAFVHPSFLDNTFPACSSTDSCEINATDGTTEFADQGKFSGGGGILYSTNNQVPSSPLPPLPPPSPYWWLTEFSKAERPPLEVDIHIQVAWTTDFDAFRICFDGTNCQETSATELFYTWNTSGWSDGNHTLSVEYRRKSDGGNWANALRYEEQFYLSPIRNGYASCDGGDGAYLRSGSDCIRLIASQRDLAPIGWADRSDLSVAVQGDYQAWVYDDVDYQGVTRLVKSGENKSVGGNVSSVKLEAAPLPPPPLPAEPFTCDSKTVSLYHFDEGSGSTVYDACSRVNGIKDVNVNWVSGKFGNALSFTNGPYGRAVDLGAPSAFNLCPMSVELWVRRFGGGRIAGQLGGGGNTGQNKWLLSTTSRPKLEIWSAGGSRWTESYMEFPDSDWHLLMFTFDCGNTGKIYLDNEVVGTVTTDSKWWSGNTTFEIGSGESIYRFYGEIDEVRVSNVVRTPQWEVPVADFSADPTTGTAPHPVDFTDSSTGTITGWSWNFGDGSTSTEQYPLHYYNAPGDYSVGLTVTGPGGSDTKTQSALVHVTLPMVFTASPSLTSPGQSIQASWGNFDPSGNDWISMHPAGAPDSNYLTWQWASESSGSVTFQAPLSSGDYDFRLFRNGTKVATSNVIAVYGNNLISGNTGVGGVTLSYTDGTPKTVTSASNGNYTITVPYGWSGTVTPSKTGYTFSPVSRTYSNVLTDQTDQNYTATGAYRIYLPLVIR